MSEQALEAAIAGVQCRPVLTMQDMRWAQGMIIKQAREVDIERYGDTPGRLEARTCLAALELAEKTHAGPGVPREDLEAFAGVSGAFESLNRARANNVVDDPTPSAIGKTPERLWVRLSWLSDTTSATVGVVSVDDGRFPEFRALPHEILANTRRRRPLLGVGPTGIEPMTSTV
jgi:hypothetical protein